MNEKHFEIREASYRVPRHHLVNLEPFNVYGLLPWGTEYDA